MKHVIIGTAGHIDHGKSTLVEALTGTHPDRLEEEKRRGITIDLGFAFLDLDDTRLGFVDVPGHERFIRNMLAGAGGIDVMLLVIAADESIKPQTREHFDICRLLGIQKGLVALTKADLIDADGLELVRFEVEEFVRDSFMEGSPIISVSTRSGIGLDLLKHELLKAARSVSAKNLEGYLRLPIDRSFAMKGFGTVVTGTLISGKLKVEDQVHLYPTGETLRVRGLHSGGRAVEHTVAGQRTAVNLAAIDHSEVRRGMTLAATFEGSGVFTVTDRLDARVHLLSSARLLKNHTRVHFHQGTAETVAEVVLLEADQLEPGGSAYAQLRLQDKALLLPGDRFILRQFSHVVTIGGGIAIDIRPRRHSRSTSAAVAGLKTLDGGSREAQLGALLQAMGAASDREVVARTGWTLAEISALAEIMAQKDELRIIGRQPLALAAAQAVANFAATMGRIIDTFHRENPLLPGIPKQDLRSRAGNPKPELFEASLQDLARTRTVNVSGDTISQMGRTPFLTPDEARARELIEREFEQAGLRVPHFGALLEKLPVEARRAQKILQLLLHEKILVRVAEDLIFHCGAVGQLRSLLARYHKERGPQLPIPAFKELTGISRKYAIPLLEYLDREHVTRRVGNERVII